MVSRIFTEMQAGQKASTDVYYGTAVQLAPFLSRGLFRKVAWTVLEHEGVHFQDVTIAWGSAQKDLESDLKTLIKIIAQR